MHFDRVYTLYTKKKIPISLWISRGRPLDTYVRGQIFDTLWHEFRPRELKVVPDELFIFSTQYERFLRMVFIEMLGQTMVKLL